VASVSALAGGQIGYLLGRFGGYQLARRWGHKIRLDDRKLRISRYLFDTYGSKVVFLGRFITILRTYAAFLAGTSRMQSLRFSVANAAGAFVWAGIFTYLSYVAGNTLRRTSGVFSWVLVGLAIVAMVVGFLLARQRVEEFAARADAAYPAETD
jgi:membrane protein DedA with SNARE-associated domain